MNMPMELVEQFARGNGVLFIGAGLSQGAGLPSWARMMRPLADDLGLQDDADLLEVASMYEAERGRQALLDHVIRSTDTAGKAPTANHLRLPDLGASTWLTTNYDDLLERALAQAGKSIHVVVDDTDLAYSSAERLAVVKLHGDRRRPETVVVSERDYHTWTTNRPGIREKLNTLLREKTTLFLGYSLRDPDFRQAQALVAQGLGHHNRKSYAVLFNASRQDRSLLSDRGIVVLNTDAAEKSDLSESLAVFLGDLITRVDDARSQNGSRATKPRALPLQASPSPGFPPTPQMHLGESVRQSIDAMQSAQLVGLNLPELLSTLVGDAPDEVPACPPLLLYRQALVESLVDQWSRGTWLELVGEAGLGKTQLARSVSEHSGCQHVLWVCLRGMESHSARSHLRQQLARWLAELTSVSPVGSLANSMLRSVSVMSKFIAEAIPEAGLLVVDDLPTDARDERLQQELVAIARVFKVCGLRILTTSYRKVFSSVRMLLHEDIIVVQPPTFTRQEVVQLLCEAGAPDEIRTENVADLILAGTTGLPTMVAASVLWWKRHNWDGSDGIWAVLQGKPLEEIRRDTRRQLTHLLNDSAREFVYRLTLLEHEFDAELALAIARVPPTISHAVEHLDELTGPWVSQLSNSRYRVSPLLRGSGEGNLATEVKRRIRITAADHLLSGGVVDARSALPIATHLFAAGEQTRAATFLVQLMLAVKEHEQAEYFQWATWMFGVGAEWPELSLDLMIMLRALQVRTRALAGHDGSDLEADMEHLIGQSTSDSVMAVMFALMTTSLMMVEHSRPHVVLQSILHVVRLMRETDLAAKVNLPGSPEEMIWFPVFRMRSIQELRTFLECVREMNNEQRQRLFGSELAVGCASLALDGTAVRESEKPSQEQGWEELLEFLDDVQTVGQLPHAQMLAVLQARTRAVILNDYLKRPREALTLLSDQKVPVASELAFLLQYTAGRMLFYAGGIGIPEALDYLMRASRSPSGSFSYYRLDTHRLIAICYGTLGRWNEGLDWCIRAIHACGGGDETPLHERLELMGELAYVLWQAGSRRKAAAALSGLVRALAEQPETERFKETFNKAGHALGWFASMARTGRPPGSTPDGEEYTAVEPGFFGIRREQLGNWTPPTGFSRSLLLTQAAMLAEGCGMPRLALQNYDAAERHILSEGTNPLLETTKLGQASLVARFRSLGEALELGVRGARALAIVQSVRNEGGDMAEVPADALDGWTSLPAYEREKAERQVLYAVIAPAFCEVLGSGIVGAKATVASWREVFSSHAHNLMAPQFWLGVCDYLISLEHSWENGGDYQKPKGVLEDEIVLKLLTYLVRSVGRGVTLVDSLRLQAFAVDPVLQKASSMSQMLPGIARFLLRFWREVAQNRGFALNGPQLFRDQLAAIRTTEDTRVVTRILRDACRAVGVFLPVRIADTFRQFETGAP